MPSGVSCRHSTTASWRKHDYKWNSRLVMTVSGFNKSWLLASNLNVNVYRLHTTLSYSVLLNIQRWELQARYDQELAEERERVRRDVGNQHNLVMEGMHNEQWQQERAYYLQQIGDNQQLR